MAKLNYSIALNLLTNGVNEGAKKVEGIFQKMKASITNTLGTIGIGLGIGTITTSMIEQSKEFQEQMAHIKGDANATSGEIKNIQDVALKMGATTNYSATEAAQAMGQMVTNSVSAADATKILGTTLEFAEARSIDTSKAADILTQQMKAFGMSVTEANAKKVSDVLSFAAPKVGGIDKLTESLREVAPVAKTAGIGIEDTVSAVTGLMQAGMESTQAGTTVMQLITRLSAQTPQAAKVFKQFGVDINAATLKADGLSGTLKKLEQSGIGNNSSAMATIFGKRAYAGAETLIANYQKVMQLNGELQKSNGTTARQAEDNAQTVEGTIKGIKALWDTSLVDIGKSTNGPLAGILHAVRSLLTSIASDMTGFIVKIGVIFAGVKGLNFWKNWKVGFKSSSNAIVQDAISMNGELATLKRKEVSLEKTLDKENTEFFNSSCDQIDAIQLKRNQTIAQLEENRTAQEKLQAEARVATERAAAMQTGSNWEKVQIKLQMGAEKVGAAFKSMWAQFGPMIIISALVEIISDLKEIYDEHVRIKNMAADYNQELKKAEQEYSPQLDKMERLKKALNDNKLTVTQHKNIVGQINSLLGTRITNEKDLNKILNDRIGILKQAADVEFYENQKLQAQEKITEIQDKYGGRDPRKLPLLKPTKKGIAGFVRKLLLTGPASALGSTVGTAVNKYKHRKKDSSNIHLNYMILERSQAGLDKATKSGTLVDQSQQYGNLGGNNPVDSRTIDTSTHHHKETAAEKAAKAAAEELANMERDYSDSLKKLNWQYKNGYITESDYLSQLKDLTKNTYMQSQTAKYALSRNSKLGGELGNMIAGKPSDKFINSRKIPESKDALKELFKSDDLVKFHQIQEQLNTDLKKYDKQLAAGAITLNEAYQKKYESYAEAYKNSSALNLNDKQKNQSNDWRESAIRYEGNDAMPPVDPTFNYDLSQVEKLQAELDNAKDKLSHYQDMAKNGINQFSKDIGNLEIKRDSLTNALKAEKFKQDIKDARREAESDIGSIVDNVENIGESWEGVQDVFKNSNESVFKKTLAIFQALLRTVRSIEEVSDAISDIKFAIGKLTGAEAAKKAAGNDVKKGVDAFSGLLGGDKKDKDKDTKDKTTTGKDKVSGAASAAKTGISKLADVAASKLAEKTAKQNAKAMAKEAAAARDDADATEKLAASKFFLAEASKGFPGAALAAAATTIMIASVKAAKPFAHGGIIHGKPFDGSIARVSDGEMIVNSYQQQKLWNAISSGNLGGNNQAGGEVTFTIKGHDLQGVLDNYNRKMGRAR
jgi:TP901 family phage tail tape measure protein